MQRAESTSEAQVKSTISRRRKGVQKKIQKTSVLLLGLMLSGYAFMAALQSVIGGRNELVLLVRAITVILMIRLIWLSLSCGGSYKRNQFYWALGAMFWFMYSIRIVYDLFIVELDLTFGIKEYIVLGFGAGVLPYVAGRYMEFGHEGTRSLGSIVLLISISILLVWMEVLGVFPGQAIKSVAHGRLSIGTINPITIGHLGASLVIISSYLIVKNEGKPSLYISLLLGIVTAIASGSKGPLLAMLISITTMFLYSSQGRFRIGVIPIFFLSSFFLYLIAQSLEVNYGFQTISRVDNALIADTTQGRISMVLRAIDQFLSSPLVGSSLEEQIAGFYPHNIVIESFMAGGVLLGSLMTVILIKGFLESFSMVRNRSPRALMGLLFIQYGVGSMVSGAIWSNGAMWLFLGAVLSSSFGDSEALKNSNRKQRK